MLVLAYVAAGLAPALLWLGWVRMQDRERPEPARLVLRAFVAGAAATALVLLVRPPLEDLLPPGTGLDRALLDAFVLTAPLEELAKGLAILTVLFHRELDEPLDGLVYGAAAGLGFASVENVVYVLQEQDATVAAVRGFTATLAHLATSGSMGFLLGMARLGSRARRALWIAAGVVAPVVFHGCYDLFLIAEGGLAWASLLCVLPLMLVAIGVKVRWARAQR